MATCTFVGKNEGVACEQPYGHTDNHFARLVNGSMLMANYDNVYHDVVTEGGHKLGTFLDKAEAEEVRKRQAQNYGCLVRVKTRVYRDGWLVGNQ